MKRALFAVYVAGAIVELLAATVTRRSWFVGWWGWPFWLYAACGIWFAYRAWRCSLA